MEESRPLVFLKALVSAIRSRFLETLIWRYYPGDLIGMAGPNGSGKTTLFRAILGLLPVLSGSLVAQLSVIEFWLCSSKHSARSLISPKCGRSCGDGLLWPLASLPRSPVKEKERDERNFASDWPARSLRRDLFFRCRVGRSRRMLIARALMVNPEDHDIR